MVFKIYHIKLRNYAFLSSVALSLVLLALATPVIFHFDQTLGIGYYSVDRDYRIDYSSGYGELNMDLELDRLRTDWYSLFISCRLSSSDNVEIIGISSFNSSINVAGSVRSYDIFNWEPPRASYSYSSSVKLMHQNGVSWNGSAMVHFIVDNIVQNETISYNLSFVIPMSSLDYYHMDLISYVLLFFWIISFVLIPLILKTLIQPQFGLHFDEEAKEKRKEYFDFLKERKIEEEE